MTIEETSELDPKLVRELFDLRGEAYEARGGSFAVDLDPIFNRLRDEHPVHEGTPGDLAGYTGPSFFAGLPLPDRPHFTVFDFETCSDVLKNQALFSANQNEVGSEAYNNETMLLFMDKQRHRRLRALVQRNFLPTKMGWWLDNWIAETIDSLIELVRDKGKADLNVEVFAAIPLLTICRSFGVSVADALEIRAGVVSDGVGLDAMLRIVMPIVADRRTNPQDDLISVLVQAELTEEDGSRHTLSDDDVWIFSFLLLAAGSGTTWKQMGLTMLTLLNHPEWLDRLRAEPDLIDDVVEETLRWLPTDPAFARHATEDTELHGVPIPKGSVLHLCFSSANRDPNRWDDPDVFDPARARQGNLGFGGGPHVCLGQHVARTEIKHAITAVLSRLPGLRLDTEAEPPKVTGMYERGPTSIPVVWDVPEPTA